MIKAIYLSLIITVLCCSTSCSMIRKSDRAPNSELDDVSSRSVSKTTHMELKNGKKYVLDKSEAELKKLKTAIEKFFSLKCPLIENSNGYFMLEIASCFPPKISKLIGTRTTDVPGPNCYSYALHPLGVIDPLRRVMDDHHELFFNENSAFCNRLATTQEKIPGDIVYMGGHAFTYLTDKFALSVSGAGAVYEITTNKENLVGGELKDYPFYRCKTPKIVISADIVPTISAIKKFNEYLAEYFFVEGVEQKNLEMLKNKIDILERNITEERAKDLLKNSSNPLVLFQLYGLVGMYYSISKIQHRLQNSSASTYSEAKSNFYRSAHLTYLKVLDRIADPEQSIIFDTYSVGIIDEFCKTDRNIIPNLCAFHDLYNQGELSRFSIDNY